MRLPRLTNPCAARSMLQFRDICQSFNTRCSLYASETLIFHSQTSRIDWVVRSNVSYFVHGSLEISRPRLTSCGDFYVTYYVAWNKTHAPHLAALPHAGFRNGKEDLVERNRYRERRISWKKFHEMDHDCGAWAVPSCKSERWTMSKSSTSREE